MKSLAWFERISVIRFKLSRSTIHTSRHTFILVIEIQITCFHSVGASCKREKLKPSRISAFKGSAQNNESAGRASGSKVPENSVKLKGSEDPVTESPKANDVPLSFISEANESIGSSPAIQKLFLKWLTMLHTQSPSQVVDGVLEEPPISELSKIQQVTQNKEREKILRAAWCYFLCLDATVKIPLLML